MKDSSAIVCFCKIPKPGLVKTRLAKKIGAEKAAAVYKNLLEDTLTKISGHDMNVLLYCHPNKSHPVFEKYKSKFSLLLHEQRGCDIGEKMFNAFKESLNTYKNVVLIGSDCPQLDMDYIQNAFDQLNNGCDVVLVPTIDGGYALIGANKIHSDIFRDVDWSTDQVATQTMERISKLGWSSVLLSKIRDLDEYDDYEYFLAHQKYSHLFQEI